MTTILVVLLALLLVGFVAFAAGRQMRNKSEHSAYYGRSTDVQRYDYGIDHTSGP